MQRPKKYSVFITDPNGEKQIEDLGKAKWYIEREIQRLKTQLSNESNT